MATSKPDTSKDTEGYVAKVATRTNEAGDLELGAEVDGIFVPFVQRSKAHVDRIIEKGKALEGDK